MRGRPVDRGHVGSSGGKEVALSCARTGVARPPQDGRRWRGWELSRAGGQRPHRASVPRPQATVRCPPRTGGQRVGSNGRNTPSAQRQVGVRQGVRPCESGWLSPFHLPLWKECSQLEVPTERLHPVCPSVYAAAWPWGLPDRGRQGRPLSSEAGGRKAGLRPHSRPAAARAPAQPSCTRLAATVQVSKSRLPPAKVKWWPARCCWGGSEAQVMSHALFLCFILLHSTE